MTEKEGQRDKDRNIDRQTYIQMDIQTSRQADSQTRDKK